MSLPTNAAPMLRRHQAPVLVLSGDLDSLTPAAQAATVTHLFARGKQIIVQNSFHVTALGDQDDCASEIVRRFVRTLQTGDTSCVQSVAEIHLLPKFASSAAELDPLTPLTGNEGSDADLRVAAAAAYTVGDALTRWLVNYSGSGVGLYGGTFHYDSSADPSRFVLVK